MEENENEDDDDDYKADEEGIFDGQYDGDQDGPYNQHGDYEQENHFQEEDEYGWVQTSECWAHNLLSTDADSIIFLIVKKYIHTEKTSLEEGEYMICLSNLFIIIY